MFSKKEIVRSVENELILLNLFEWRAVSVLFLQSEVGKQCSPKGFVHKQFVLLKICRKYEQMSCLQWLLETTVGHFNCL